MRRFRAQFASGGQNFTIDVTTSLVVTTNPSTMADNIGTMEKKTVNGNHKIVYASGMNDKGDQVLWLCGTEIEFQAYLVIEDYSILDQGWTFGLCQTIRSLSRVGHYEGGAQHRMRLNVENGALRDGQDCYLFYLTEEEIDHRLIYDFVDDDSPNFEMPLTLGGKNLIGTEGRDVFETYPVLAHDDGQALVCLPGGVGWTIDWQGTFNPTTRIWQPPHPDRFMLIENRPISGAYPNAPTQRANLPFSTKFDTAEAYFERFVGSEWRSCNSRGKLKDVVRTATHWPDGF